MIEREIFPFAPELEVQRWFNTPAQLSLAQLRGRVVVIEAFQMLCPGCVVHGLPQAAEIARVFADDDVSVIGLHSVFEHHAAMQPHALEAFLHEYRIGFPVAVDRPADAGDGPLPKTMRAYGLQGTPSLIIIDRQGRLRARHFGQAHDMRVAREITGILSESADYSEDEPSASVITTHLESGSVCTPDGCSI